MAFTDRLVSPRFHCQINGRGQSEGIFSVEKIIRSQNSTKWTKEKQQKLASMGQSHEPRRDVILPKRAGSEFLLSKNLEVNTVT